MTALDMVRDNVAKFSLICNKILKLLPWSDGNFFSQNKGTDVQFWRRHRGKERVQDFSENYLMRCNQSSKRKAIRPIRRERRAMMVYPKDAPKETIRNQIPTLEARPTTPVCSTE